MIGDRSFALPTDPSGVEREIIVVCGCGHRTTINLTALARHAEAMRAALDVS